MLCARGRDIVFGPVLSAVLLKVVLDLELLVADVALVGQHLVHQPLVRAQRLGLGERVSADATRVRTKALVQQNVSAKDVARGVSISAVVALVRSRLAAVTRCVRLKAGAVRETFAAHLARETLLACVRHHVLAQTRFAVGAPSANLASLRARLR